VNAEGSLTIMNSRQVIAVAAVHTNLAVSEYPSARDLTDGDARDAVEGMSSQQTFKVTSFYVVTDQLKSALEKRIKAYSLVLQIFGILTKYESTSDEDIDVANAITRLGMYSKYLSSDFPAEVRQCICWIKEQRPD